MQRRGWRECPLLPLRARVAEPCQALYRTRLPMMMIDMVLVRGRPADAMWLSIELRPATWDRGACQQIRLRGSFMHVEAQARPVIALPELNL